MDQSTNPADYDLVELCIDSQFYRGNVHPARSTWVAGFKHGYKAEAYHSGVFFTTDVNRHINERHSADLEAYKVAKAKYDQAMVDAIDDTAAQKELVEPKRPRRSLRKYKGWHWSPFFMLDIDTRRVGPKYDLVKEGEEEKWHKRSEEEGQAWLEANPDYVEDTDAPRVEALEVIRCLEKLGVDPELLIICFSGNKGFHIYVPTATFNPEPCVNFIYRIRWMVQHALVPMVDKEKIPYPVDSIDWQVFDRLKVLRAVNSMHQSKGWKVPIAYRTLQSTSLDQIRKRATGPNLEYEHPNWRDVAPAPQLRELWENPECEAFKKPGEQQPRKERGNAGGNEQGTDRERPRERRRRSFDMDGRITLEIGETMKVRGPVPNRPICMIKLGKEDVGSGNRHQACLMLLSTWWKEGYTADQALLLGREWLKLQKGTRHDDDYLQQQVESVYDDSFNWSCNHPLAMRNCFKQCKRYPEAERSREVALHHFPDLLDQLLEREKQEALYFLPYEPFKEEIKLRSKQVLFFVAETATGKTAFMIDVCRANSQGIDYLRSLGENIRGGCGFASLEMPREELAERGAQWILGEDQKHVASILHEQIEAEETGGNSDRYQGLKDLLYRHHGNIWVSDENGVGYKKLKAMIERGKEEHGIGLWVVDYMGRMAGKGMNQHERISAIARDMKTLARECDVVLIILVQVGRTTSKEGAPGLRSGRGSGEIEESADILITAHRPDRHEDKEMTEEDQARKKADDKRSTKGYRVKMTAHKVRGGSPGMISELWFEGRSMRFTPIKEWERQEQEYVDSYDGMYGL